MVAEALLFDLYILFECCCFKLSLLFIIWTRLSLSNAPSIVFLTACALECQQDNVIPSVLGCISFFLFFFPPHRSSSAGTHPRGRVRTFSLALPCAVNCCTCLLTQRTMLGANGYLCLCGCLLCRLLLHVINTVGRVSLFSTDLPSCPTQTMAAFTLWEERTTKGWQ